VLGEDVTASLMQHLSKREVARIAREVADLGAVSPGMAQQVLEEYYLAALDGPQQQGGPDVARRILARASIAEDLAEHLLGSQEAEHSGDALGPLLEARPDVLARALRDEHPQTMALVLLHLPAPRAASLLAALPEAARGETVLRMATLRQVRGEVLGEVATSLHERLSAHKSQDAGDGLARTVAVLGKMARLETKRVLDELESGHPDEVARLRAELFTFESLVAADDRGMQELLRQIDSGKLGLALLGADAALQDRFLKNLSERGGGLLREEMEYLGTPNPKDQALARREILEVALRLEADGSLTFVQVATEDED
jgi:flagellar motor switch protein FliG